jgi:4-aminobutyrate aminotransferase-like enzyme
VADVARTTRARSLGGTSMSPLRTAPGRQATDYDHEGEAARVDWPDVLVGERRLHRARARVHVTGPVETPATEAERDAVKARLFSTTLAPDSPVVELGWPVHGPFVAAPFGTYFDGYLGVAQKVLDEHHPRFKRMVDDLVAADVLLRREIATDDYLVARAGTGVKTPTDLAAAWNDALQERWARPDGWRAFFSSSGTEAVEAALKLSFEVAYKRFLATHGAATFERVQAELGAEKVAYFDRDASLRDHPVWSDYPFQVVACEGAFHGRTLGSLQLTRSKRAHQLGYPKASWVRHVPYNAPGPYGGEGDPVRALVDFRGIAEILAVPGELRRVLREQRRIPKDLFAAFVAEPFQGEGGYVPGDAAFFAAARKVCDETGALLVADEVQSVARTGRLLATEHLGVRPDVVATAKGMVLGVTMAGAHLERWLHTGWHSNTWGAGRVLDVNLAWTVLDVLLHHKDPVFLGLSYMENEETKGARLAEGLDRLAEAHPKTVVGHRGLGLMRGLVVRKREEVVRAGWRRGIKLLGCGLAGETSTIRLVFLADTLSREIDECLRVLDETLTDVERA